MEITKRAFALAPASDRVRVAVPAAIGGVLLAVLLGLLSPAIALWVVLGGAAVALAVAAPWMLLCLIPPAIALDTVIELDVGPLHAGPTDILVGALVLGWCWRTLAGALAPSTPTSRARSWRPAQPRWWSEPAARAVAISLGAYVVIVVLSVAVAHDHTAALKEVLKWAEVLIVYSLAADELLQAERRRAVVWFIIAAGVVEALLGYAQWVAAVGDLGVGSASVRVFGTFSQPNPFAAYLNLSLPLAIALAAFGQRASERWLAAGATVLLLGAQALAASRGGLIGLAAALIVMAALALGVVRQALAAGIAIGVLGGAAWALGIVPASLRDRLLHALRLDNVSINGPVNDANFSSVERLAHWVAGLRMFAAHPLLGVGAGNYPNAYPLYKVPSWNQALGHAHNYYINAAAETGVLGLLAVLAVAITALWLVWRAAVVERAALPPPERRSWRLPSLRHGTAGWWLAIGLAGAVTSVVVHSVVDDLFVHGMELQLALLLALGASLLAAHRGMAAGTET